MSARLLTRAQTAELLGLTVRSFVQRRAPLEAAGFPAAVPALGDRWDPAAIEAWLARHRGEAPIATTAAPPAETEEAHWHAILSQRAANLGRAA